MCYRNLSVPSSSLSVLADAAAHTTTQSSKRRKTPAAPTSKVKTRPPAVLNLRTSPNGLFNLVRQLSDDQKAAVRAIGFGSLLCLGISKIPFQMCRHLLSHFNYRSCSLILSNGELLIDEDDVKCILNLPRGDVHVTESIGKSDDGPEYLELLGNWRRRWVDNAARGAPLTASMARRLISNKAGDDDFKRDFVVFVVSSFLWGTQGSQCRFRILKSLINVDCIKDLNWCKFTLDGLVASVKNWQKNTNSYFHGPLTFLLLCYMDRVVDYTVSSTFVRNFPILSCWDDKMVLQRKRMEEKDGGFGFGRVIDRIPLISTPPGIALHSFVDEASPVEEASHVEEASPVQEPSPVVEDYPVEDASPVEEASHVEEASAIAKGPLVEECSHPWYDQYDGLMEYPGKEKLPSELKQYINQYLEARKYWLMVWGNDLCDIDGETLYSCLFGGMTSSRLLDAFADCLVRSARKEGSPCCFVLPSFVQMEIYSNMMANKRTKKKSFELLLDSISSSAKIWLEKIDERSLQTLEYVISPVYCNKHWAVLIYKVRERRFWLRDSLGQNRMKKATDYFAHFLSDYWEWEYNHVAKPFGRCMVEFEYTRRQTEEGVDCGVHAAMSMERYIYGPSARGKYLDEVEVDMYRASIVATILKDDYCILDHLFK